MSDITYYTVETYAIFKGVDRSILKANTFIEKYGYRFLAIDLQELEKNFSDLFSLPKNFQRETIVSFENSNIKVSNEFCRTVTNNNAFGIDLMMRKELILLKRIQDFDQIVINKTVNSSLVLQFGGEMQKFVTSLIQQFRLFKNGGISCFLQFQIATDTRQVISRLTNEQKPIGNRDFSLTDIEAESLSKIFKETVEINSLTELAVNNFNLSYEITDNKTRYVTLMTCLESLFNQGRDQITHTVSRHLALIISNSEEEFLKNFKQIKKLYHLRSMIVHGHTPNEDLVAATDELQNKVRYAINYCLALKNSKEELFDKLNVMGFGR